MDYQFLIGVGDGITSQVVLTKFITNRCNTVPLSIEQKVGVYTQENQSTEWHKVDEKSFGPSSFLTFDSEDYGLDVGQIAVVVPVAPDAKLDPVSKTLPKPISRKVDPAPASERGAIRFIKGNSQSSYQGEYPYQMSDRSGGTLLSFGPLFLGQPSEAHTKILLLNMHSGELSDKKEFQAHLASVSTKNILQTCDYTYNSAAVFHIEHSLISEELVLFSHHTAGIPIYVTYEPNVKDPLLSVEHTHPPTDYFWDDPGCPLFKKTWLSRFPSSS